ncbi:GntR family transcriptional regulator [Marinilactibacillus sp. XAAS-LB27]|uniref:GntR family transcriptional regulator n=1 Tax=Marinilactibacillus sp. XAAS-LB27 TaxID=3114538 RepID=UPI002E17258D|nr:GntR family transcriptional regulator [Marinilactibacillus sp. XAAS-LB27]
MKRTKLLYIEIAETLRKKILSGEYPVSSLIPSEVELERTFDVSKITIRKAVELLVADGYLEKRSGKGTTVISDRLFNNLSKARSFSSIVEASGQTLEKKILDIKKVELTLENEELYDYFGNKAYELTRLYYLNNQAYIYFKHYLPVLGNEAHLKTLESSLYKWLDQFGKQVERFEDSFAVEKIDFATQQLLETENQYILKRIRRTLAKTGETIELSYAFYDTEKYPYKIDYDV